MTDMFRSAPRLEASARAAARYGFDASIATAEEAPRSSSSNVSAPIPAPTSMSAPALSRVATMPSRNRRVEAFSRPRRYARSCFAATFALNCSAAGPVNSQQEQAIRPPPPWDPAPT
jgi:hypothetical protein